MPTLFTLLENLHSRVLQYDQSDGNWDSLFLGFGLFLICFCGFICWNRGQHFGFQNFRRNSNACNVQQRPRQSPIPFYLWCEQLCFIIISWFLFLYIIIIIIPISLHLQFLVSWLTCIFLFCVYVFSSEENSLKS